MRILARLGSADAIDRLRRTNSDDGVFGCEERGQLSESRIKRIYAGCNAELVNGAGRAKGAGNCLNRGLNGLRG